MLFKIFFGFLPCFSVISSWYAYKLRLSNLRFGGVQPVSGPGYTLCNMLGKYCQTLCWGLGFCGAWEAAWVDRHITFAGNFGPQQQMVIQVQHTVGCAQAEIVGAALGHLPAGQIVSVSHATQPAVSVVPVVQPAVQQIR